jgi:hypothetical protein
MLLGRDVHGGTDDDGVCVCIYMMCACVSECCVWSEKMEERRERDKERSRRRKEGRRDDMMAMVMGVCALLRNWTSRWMGNCRPGTLGNC